MRSKRTAKQQKRWLVGTLLVIAGLFVTVEVSSAAMHVPLPWQEQQEEANSAHLQKQAQSKQQTSSQKQQVAQSQPQSKAVDATDSTKPVAATTAADGLPAQADVRVTAQSQQPELYNGCEVTSLSMLLSSAGQSVAKTTLADAVRKDPTPEQQDDQGNTIYWGNPNNGFVGDVTGANRGYGVYHGPIYNLMQQYLPGRAVDLTGSDFNALLGTLAAGKPLVVWTTVTFAPPTSWVTWNSPSGQVRATFDEHACLLVGYDANTVTVCDPLDGQRKQVDRSQFMQSWIALGRQAVTYK